MSYRYELLGTVIEVATAADAAALSEVVKRVRADEREECAKIADAYVENKMNLADACDARKDPDGAEDAVAAAGGAKTVAFLIRQRSVT